MMQYAMQPLQVCEKQYGMHVKPECLSASALVAVTGAGKFSLSHISQSSSTLGRHIPEWDQV